MRTLRDTIKDAAGRNAAVGHFNISDIVALRAIFDAALELKVPVIIGTSESERSFIGTRQAAALVRSLREEHDFPIFINADHAHSFESIHEAVEAGYDAVLFDGGALPIAKNVTEMKRAVAYVRSVNPDIIIEGELGYIGKSSVVHNSLPDGVSVDKNSFTTPEDAQRFVLDTGVDLLAPAVGNIHGMLAGVANPRLDIERIRAIREATETPLVLHGGSGVDPRDSAAAIAAGVAIIHVNTELRVAWRSGIEQILGKHPDEVRPYRLLEASRNGVTNVVRQLLREWNRL